MHQTAAGAISARQLIRRWALLNRAALDATWSKIKASEPLNRIPPLEEERSAMVLLPQVVRATYEKAYRIRLTFNDGTESIVDFEFWLTGPVFEPLKQTAYFRKFFIDGGTVVWPNGADIAPETLYEAAVATRSNLARQPTAATNQRRRG